jgi:hypothetical protein
LTLIAGYFDSSKKLGYLAVDSSCSGISGLSSPLADPGEKVWIGKGFIIGATGLVRTWQVIQGILENVCSRKGTKGLLSTEKGIKQWARVLPQALGAHLVSGATSPEDGAAVFPIAMLVLNKEGVFVIDNSLSVLKSREGYGTIGAGGDVCMGAFKALLHTGFQENAPAAKLELAAQIAIAHTQETSLPLRIYRLNARTGSVTTTPPLS